MSESNQSKRNLVVVRTGEGSLHHSWLSHDSVRNWDLIESYYGSEPEKNLDPRFDRIVDRGLKWDSLHRLFLSRPALLKDYDYIWLPDDDLACQQAAINQIFELTRQFDLLVSQPSLSGASYYSHPTMLHNPEFLLRHTNFIEVMCPCFKTSYLEKILPLLELSPSGWGLDFVWSMIAEKPRQRSAVLDQVSVTHTRPMGEGPIYDALAKLDRVPRDDMEAILERFVERPQRPATYSGIRSNGRDCWFPPRVAWLTRKGLESLLGEISDPPKLKKEAIRHCRKRLRNPPRSRALRYKPGREIPGLALPIHE
jgi:hypothetical protein